MAMIVQGRSRLISKQAYDGRESEARMKAIVIVKDSFNHLTLVTDNIVSLGFISIGRSDDGN